MRILFIARYRDVTMDRKVALMAAQPGVTVVQVKPQLWQDELFRVEQRPAETAWRQVAVPMLGRPNDPHRAVYRTSFAGLRDVRPDIVQVEEEPDSLAAMQLAAVRSVWWPRARLVLYTWQNLDRRMGPHVRAARALSLAAADAVLCASEEARALLRTKGYRRPVAVLPALGVDTTFFRPVGVAEPEGTAFRVGYAGRLVPEKGVDLLIRAFAALPGEPLLALIGDGPEREPLAALCRQTGVGDRVEFEGAMPPADVARRLPALDALVLPSRTTAVWKEQFGRVLVEAMACGVPVIGSSSGAIPEVIGDAGLVVPEENVGALTAALALLADSPELRASLAANGLARVRSWFTQEVIAAETLSFYRRLLGGASGDA